MVLFEEEEATSTDASIQDLIDVLNERSNSGTEVYEDVYRGIDAYTTDYRLYTVNVTQAPTTLGEQSYALELEIRNLLLILIFLILLFRVYGMIKNTFTTFFGRD